MTVDCKTGSALAQEVPRIKEGNSQLPTSRLSIVAALYERHLGRTADSQGLRRYVESTLDEREIEDTILGSEECRQLNGAIEEIKLLLSAEKATPNLLLFGAYGNGNLGDRAMAEALAGWIEENNLGTCFAHSDIDHVDYPFSTQRVLHKAMQPLNPRITALFDGLLIGGGGLLACPHEPLWDPAWPYQIPIPYALLGCGVGQPMDSRLANLVRLADVASARDEDSVKEFRRFNLDACLCPDPILALYAPPTRVWRPIDTRRRCFILRGPVRPWHRAVLSAYGPGDQVILFEAGCDWQLFYLFPDAVFVRTLDDAASHIFDSDLVITERFHGAIVGLLCARPTLAVYKQDHNSGKLRALFSGLDIGDLCQEDPAIPESMDNFPWPSVEIGLAAARTQFDKQARAILKTLKSSASEWPARAS